MLGKTSQARLQRHWAKVSVRQRLRSVRCRADASVEYEKLKGLVVKKASSGEDVELLSLWQPEPNTKVVIPFLTHFGDLTSWELAQKLVRVLPTLESSDVRVLCVGIGSVEAAQEFARTLRFPVDRLYADPDASTHKALGFSPGFLPGVEVSAYAKLLPMLAGVGSPGTIQEVLRGYVGDQGAKPVFDSPTPFDVLGTGYQRPFELATLRLFNMIGILPKWGELTPKDEQLLLQQGGCLAFDGTATIFRHDDPGILKYMDVDDLMRAVLGAEEVVSAGITVAPAAAVGATAAAGSSSITGSGSAPDA